MISRWGAILGWAALPALVYGYAPTDSTQDTDAPQSGYLPNHNMDPAAVASSLSITWTKVFNNAEVFYAKPLVYTPAGAPNEYTILVSSQNIVRVLDGLTGAVITTRTLDPPFQAADTACGDIQNTIGITGTPIIDRTTDIMYFFSKGYKNGATGGGAINGQYKMYGVKIPSLTDAIPPVIIDGHYANNDPTRYFIGGTVLNRPGLAMIGNSIVAGFGGHCDNFNYTGMLVSVSKSAGVGVTNIQAMITSPYPSAQQDLNINPNSQGGGKAGIWQSGMGIAADTTKNRVFFLTGNARGPGQNGGANGKPASGKVPIKSLEQAACNFGVDPNTGALTQQDYFESYAYDSLNGGDRDFGSSGIALLDPGTFNLPGVNRLAVAAGKDGRMYIMDADNLGGFAGGNAGGDNVLQVLIIPGGSGLYSGVASYPLEGGYIYFNPAQPNNALYAYSFSKTYPYFVQAGKSNSPTNPNGQSVPTITTNNGQPGTGIVWLHDSNQGLMAFKAVPVNGVLSQIILPKTAATGGLTKYKRPAFGNARVYVTKAATVMALGGGGSATSPAYSCTPNPLAFGNVNTGSISTIQVTCKANTAITNLKCSTTLPTFVCPAGVIAVNLASGASVTFPVTFNLTEAATDAYTAKGGTVPGSEADSLSLTATAGAGYSGGVVVPMTGTAVATGGYLAISQNTVSFGGTNVGGASTMTFSLTNKGQGVLTFSGFDWYDFYVKPTTYHNVTTTGGTSIVGNSFSATNFPAVGSTIAAGATLKITATFKPTAANKFASYLYFYSNGGSLDVLFQGTAAASASTSTTAKPTTSTAKPTTSAKATTTMVTTTKGNGATTTTVIKPTGSLNPNEPPVVGTFNYIGCYNDLVNGQRSLNSPMYTNATMDLAACAKNCDKYDYFGTTYGTECFCGYTLNSTLRGNEADCNTPCAGNKAQLCGASGRLSTYQNTIVHSAPAGPSHVAVSGNFVWQGCFTEATTGRALSSKSFTSATMTVESCVSFCSTNGYSYAGIEYAQECYCGNTLGAGSAVTTTASCNKLCTGSSSEYCGGSKLLDMYKYNPQAASSLASTKTTATATSKPSSTASACAKATKVPAATKKYTWSVGWVSRSPDGFTRPFVGINGQWPLPAITVNMGDTISITVTNNLGNETTAIHFHGIFQTDTTYADGPAMVTQCPIQPGGTFVYTFTVNQPGTYWYHAHVGGQYIDGFRGPLIIQDVNAPFCYDQEVVMTLSDLYHVQAPSLINYYQSSDNTNNNNGAEPVPESILINEAQNVKFTMLPGKKYFFRIMNIGAFTPIYLQFDQHDMTVVEVDGVYTTPVTQSQLFVTVAQRYGVIVQAKTTATTNFIVRASMSQSMFNPNVIPAKMNPDVTGWLVYNNNAALPAASTFKLTPKPFDDSLFQPYDKMAALPQPDFNTQFSLTASFGPNNANQYRGYMNGNSYVPQKVPTLYTVLSAPANQRNNPTIYGVGSNPLILPYGAVIEINLNNHDTVAHPFHLHGHNFQVVDRSGGGDLFPVSNPPGAPMRRDTVQLMANGFTTLRFVADNPGINLFHCHLEWHVESGLTMTFIEAPDQLVAQKPVIPASHKAVCAAQNIPTVGNAAGNTGDYTNMTGAITEPEAQMWGALVNKPTKPAAAYPPS